MLSRSRQKLLSFAYDETLTGNQALEIEGDTHTNAREVRVGAYGDARVAQQATAGQRLQESDVRCRIRA